MGILIKTVRVAGFRGLENIEVTFERNTVLTGMNNAGKTAVLRALQLALGNQFVSQISQDDFFTPSDPPTQEIVIDMLIVPVDENGKQSENFQEDWEILFGTKRVRYDDKEREILPLRTVIDFDETTYRYRPQRHILQDWPDFKRDGSDWFELRDMKEESFRFEQIPFFYVDAKRDILEDIKFKNSYLGRMMSGIEYSEKDTKEIEKQIEFLNEKMVNRSDILLSIKASLDELDTAMGAPSGGVEIAPLTKKLRDLGKGLAIYYSDEKESFPMQHHGTGTRSWSSLLILKSFIRSRENIAVKDRDVFFPVLAIEEPEAHLHPNAQKKLYEQLNSIPGQKIISTHSPYVTAAAELNEIRSLYKKNGVVSCGQINTDELSEEDIRKIERQVVNIRGEMFFSKMFVFCEGDTEELALPIFFHKRFKKTPAGMGLNFVGVGSWQNYLPFLRFAESFNIPWIIFSDAEDDVKNKVSSDITKSGTETGCVVFLDDGNNFEKQLIQDGFREEIKKIVGNQGSELDDEELYNRMTKSDGRKKVRYGRAIAEEIVQSGKKLPPKVAGLFDKIEEILNTPESAE